MEKRQDKQENGFVGRIEGGEKELQKWWSRNMNQQQQQQHIDGANERVDEGNRNRGVRRSDRKGENGNGGDKRRAGEGKDDGVSLGNQLLLSAASFGVEMIVTFQTIYGVLSLQYLGVPVSLVSVDGMICGLSSLFIIPVIGRYTDSGTNARFRKTVSLLVGLGILLIALTLFSASTFIKINFNEVPEVENITYGKAMCNSLLGSANSTLDCHYTGIDAGLNPENNTLPFKTVTSDSSIATLLEQDTTKNITSTLHDSASSNTSKNLPVISNDLGQTILPNISRRGLDVVLNTSHISPNMSDIRPYFSYNRTIITPDDSPSTMHIPVSALIAIVGSALLCISFDVSMAPTRAFILETVPSWQHPNILRTSTVASSLAGVCLSAMGLFNVPHMFGAILHADKTAAALIFLFIFIGVLAVLSFTLTLCTGFKLLSANGNMIQLDAKNQSVKSAERSTVEKNRDSLCCCFGCRKAKGVHKYEKLSTEDLHWNDKDDSDVEIAPEFTACTLENECDEKSIQKSSLGFISPQCVQNHLVGNGEQPREVPHEAGEIGGEHVPSSICDTREWGEPDSENHQCPWQRDNKEIEVCNVTEPTHLLTNSYLGANCDNHPQTLGYGKEKSLSLPEIPPKNHANSNLTLDTSGIPAGPNFCNRRLVIFLAASFFSFGNLLVFLTFASNSLTIAVYKGDPKAPQGSEARGNYERGLRMCSVGVFAYYVAYFIMSSCNKKVLDIVGPHVLFIVANLLMGVACLVFVYTSHLAAYFWAMLSCSLHKSMSYTVPFLLATQYSLQDQIQDDDNSKTDTGQTQKLGRVTSMIGFLFPAQSLFVCSVMGPVMDIAETAWPPMYYCFVAGCLASLIMSFLLFMK